MTTVGVHAMSFAIGDTISSMHSQKEGGGTGTAMQGWLDQVLFMRIWCPASLHGHAHQLLLQNLARPRTQRGPF